MHALRCAYLSVDPRSLGLFRIGFGLLLLHDLLYRYGQLEHWYANTGLLPNHTLLWRPPADHVFSLFFLASSEAEARFGFFVCAVVYLCFLAGYRTRVAHLLALICRVSVNSRIPVLENGGDMVINLLCSFTLALPLGSRFSLDAWLQDTAARRGDGPTADRRREPVVSLAVLGLILQFSLVYFFNAISKQGPSWKDGVAVHYALHQDKLVTGVGLWMRQELPLDAIKALTWGTLTVEWVGFALILTPFFIHAARAIAVVMLPLLHLGFACALHLGNFSWAMMSFYPLLLTHVHWDRLARVGERLGPALARRLPSPPRGVVQWARRAVRAEWVMALRAPPPRFPRARRVLHFGGECAVALLITAIGIEIVNDNTSVPQWMRVERPAWQKAVIEYPRLLQGWRMFAPDVGKRDSMIYVDALTASGEHVDPYNKVASRMAFPAGDTVPPRMGQSQFFTMYSDRIAQPHYAAYRQAFKEWLVAYPKRTGRQSDCLRSFRAYLLIDQSPPPGVKAPPTFVDRIEFLRYEAPRDGSCPPQRPQLRSSEPRAAAPVTRLPR